VLVDLSQETRQYRLRDSALLGGGHRDAQQQIDATGLRQLDRDARLDGRRIESFLALHPGHVGARGVEVFRAFLRRDFEQPAPGLAPVAGQRQRDTNDTHPIGAGVALVRNGLAQQ
jgi:hypothetical protein